MIGARDVGGETVNDPDSGQGGCAKFQWRFVCSAAGEGARIPARSTHCSVAFAIFTAGRVWANMCCAQNREFMYNTLEYPNRQRMYV